MNKVYLAGPITGCTWSQSEDWRDTLKSMEIKNVELFSPLRGKQYLKDREFIADHYKDKLMSTSRAIMTRDSFDVRTSAAIVVNFQGSKRISIGTVMEIAWAWDQNKPVIAIYDELDDKPDLHDHSMLNEAVSWKVYNLEDAADILRQMFNA